MARNGEPWSPLGSVQDDLSLEASRIDRDAKIGGMQLPCPMTTIGRVFKVGPTHHLIGHTEGRKDIGAYRWTPLKAGAYAAGAKALWSADGTAQRQLVCEATHRGETWRQDKADDLAGKQGRLHYARGMRWTSQAVLAAMTAETIFGGRAWTTLRHKDEHLLRCFALWANSVFGLLVHWTQASRTQTGRAPTQVAAIGEMPCPDFAKLDECALRNASEKFEGLKQLKMLPACQAHVDPARQQIDSAVIHVLGFDVQAGEAAAQRLRQAWCAEPTVHGGKRAALHALARAGLAAGGIVTALDG